MATGAYTAFSSLGKPGSIEAMRIMRGKHVADVVFAGGERIGLRMPDDADLLRVGMLERDLLPVARARAGQTGRVQFTFRDPETAVWHIGDVVDDATGRTLPAFGDDRWAGATLVNADPNLGSIHSAANEIPVHYDVFQALMHESDRSAGLATVVSDDGRAALDAATTGRPTSDLDRIRAGHHPAFDGHALAEVVHRPTTQVPAYVVAEPVAYLGGVRPSLRFIPESVSAFDGDEASAIRMARRVSAANDDAIVAIRNDTSERWYIGLVRRDAGRGEPAKLDPMRSVGELHDTTLVTASRYSSGHGFADFDDPAWVVGQYEAHLRDHEAQLQPLIERARDDATELAAALRARDDAREALESVPPSSPAVAWLGAGFVRAARVKSAREALDARQLEVEAAEQALATRQRTLDDLRRRFEDTHRAAFDRFLATALPEHDSWAALARSNHLRLGAPVRAAKESTLDDIINEARHATLESMNDQQVVLVDLAGRYWTAPLEGRVLTTSQGRFSEAAIALVRGGRVTTLA